MQMLAVMCCNAMYCNAIYCNAMCYNVMYYDVFYLYINVRVLTVGLVVLISQGSKSARRIYCHPLPRLRISEACTETATAPTTG